jgi:ferredoxin
MSQVRMCDRCNEIFSENEDGWQTFTATTMKEDENGVSRPISMAMDACPSCAMIPKKQYEKEQKALAAGKEQEARIAKLERQVGLDDETGTFKNVSQADQ